MGWKRWRRVPEVGACPFCLVLASRGAVYHGKETAAGKRFHRHCRCSAKAEGRYDRRTDTAISPEDADRIVTIKVNPHGWKTYQYTYDLDDFPMRPPPRAPRLSPVSQTAATPAVLEGAVTVDRLTAVRRMIVQFTDVLQGATDTQRRWLENRITALTLEAARLAAQLET